MGLKISKIYICFRIVFPPCYTPAMDLTVFKRFRIEIALGVFVLAISYVTYMHNYHQPAAPFWDENYYITDAQREINGIFYQQFHPPLGKLLIAAGEMLINGNEDDAAFVDVEHQGEFPENFSFAGYRFFPALLSWLTAIIFYGIFLLITRKAIHAGLLSSLYIFDNALIVHNRGAMLDGPVLFFQMLAILLFLLIVLRKSSPKIFATLCVFLGIAIGLAVTTKYQGAFLVLLVPPLLWKFRTDSKKVVTILVATALGFLLTFVAVWHVHFANGTIINTEQRDGGYFDVSDEYHEILDQGRTHSLLAFPTMFKESFQFTKQYNTGIPALDLCKSDENGSPWFLWPVGATAINYRWATDDSVSYRYLYMQANPIIWFAGLIGVILAAVALLAPLFEKTVAQAKGDDRFLTAVFLGMYVAYMIAMANMTRVTFIHSYMPALLLAFLLFGLCFKQAQRMGAHLFSEEHKTAFLYVINILIVLAFFYYSPLTYYKPLTDEQFQNRALLRIWNLHCVNCDLNSPLVQRRC